MGEGVAVGEEGASAEADEAAEAARARVKIEEAMPDESGAMTRCSASSELS